MLKPSNLQRIETRVSYYHSDGKGRDNYILGDGGGAQKSEFK